MMKEIKLKGIDEVMYTDTLDNGLTIYLLPNKKAKNFYITYNINFGSLDIDFTNNKGKKYKVPAGTAHFLEHLMFQEPDGTTAHEYFAKLGGSCNAATSFKITYYEVMGVNKFKENLEYLLDYVNRPYFTKKNVQNEKNIIIEEIKMGENNPYTKLVFSSLANVFHYSNYNKLISGTVDDIKDITESDIEACYENYYHPENMFVVITGNFNPLEAKAIISENMAKREVKPYLNPIRKSVKEPSKVVKEYEEIDANVEIPKISMKLKLPLSKFKGIDPVLLNIYLNIILNLKFDDTSLIKEQLLENDLISDSISTSVNITDDTVLLSLMFETKYPKETIELIKNELNSFKLSSNDLKRKAKVYINDLILSYDDIIGVCENIQNDLINYGKIVDNYYDIFRKLNVTELNKITKNIDLKNMSILVVKANEG